MKKFNRREAMRLGGILGLGAFTGIEKIWSANVNNAHLKNKKFIFESASISEYAPPPLPKLSTLKARLHWNENPFGPSDYAINSFLKFAKGGNYYSWDMLNEFTNKIAKKENVSLNQVMTGPGSSDLLEKTAISIFQHGGGNVVTADPCYMSLVNVTSSMGGDWKAVKLDENFEHDLDGMRAAIDRDTKLVYITNPNNPTATITNPKRLLNFCSEVSDKVPVFVDEAYLELSKGGLANSMAKLVSEGKDIIITRTFSKIHGMAGLRMGYMIARPERIEKINKITRGGMGISGPTIMAAMSSLDDIDFLKSCKNKITSNREYTVENLKARGFEPMPSNANFLIFELPKKLDPSKYLTQIYSKSVTVKVFKFWNKNWCRVSIGTKNSMDIFFNAFDETIA